VCHRAQQQCMSRTWSMMETGSACSATVGVAAVVEAASRSSRKDYGE
jgi:hypothetical protein